MNKGTRIRTALAIATSINTALIATDVTGFQNATLNTVYKVASLIANFVVVALVTYYNNDYTEEACLGTGVTRQLKAEKQEDYIGDVFFDEEADDESEDI